MKGQWCFVHTQTRARVREFKNRVRNLMKVCAEALLKTCVPIL